MIIIENRSKHFTVRVQPGLLNQVQNKLDNINKSKTHRERKTTISDVFEDSLYKFLENCKK